MMLGDVVAQVEMLAGQTLTRSNIDWQSYVNYVRDARRDLFLRTHPYLEWAYHSSLTVVNGTNVPDDFIRPVRLIVWELGQPQNVNYEARRVDPREWLGVVSTGRPMSFTGSNLMNPVYMIWANQVDGFTWAATTMEVWLSPVNTQGRLEYMASYADTALVESDDPVLVPVVLESLLVDMTLQRVLQDIDDTDRLRSARPCDAGASAVHARTGCRGNGRGTQSRFGVDADAGQDDTR
jgi:hypothetical protein